MAQNKAPSTSAVETKTYVFLNELELGKQSQVQVMICRSWDTHTIYGKYLGTEFIASDEQGNMIQLTAKSNVAHHFIPRLKDGFVYLLNNFDVITNRDDYHIFKDNTPMIELNGSTLLRKQPNADASTFIRHPFNCIQIEDLQPTLGKFVFGVLSLSSTSATLIIDNAEIPTLIDFKERMRFSTHYYFNISCCSWVYYIYFPYSNMGCHMHLACFCRGVQLPIAVEPSAPGWQLPPPKDGTLHELLDMARKGKKNICTVEIQNIRMKNYWYYNTCSVCKARKGLGRRFGQHWCESCNDNIPEPITRFRVICDVRDETAITVMVLFDETAEVVTQTTSKALLAKVDAETCNTVLPNALANLLGTTRVVLLKATSYYDQGT
ncbi:uncharacterized protein [Rutidosis leptorrhynchoides]|uniref:uncharacterized protein n=1 Tax=Rutidosis leptorrhynchoides TaxID=125765 RepID=UPI003A99CFC2